MTTTHAPGLSCLYYGQRTEVWVDDDAPRDFLECNSCERRFVGGTEQSQLDRFVRHKTDGVCGTPGP